MSTPVPALMRIREVAPAVPEHVAALRKVGVDCITRWRLSELADSVASLVGELAANAVTHASGHEVVLELTYCQESSVLRIAICEVGASKAGLPLRAQRPDDDAESGRGLYLVDLLAQDWGRDGTCTWCTLHTPRVTSGRSRTRDT